MDLNCDLGEGEPEAHTEELMRWVTSANIACAGHAGNALTMERSLRQAKQQNLRAGAHPGWPNPPDFGRSPITPTAEQLETLLLHQIGALQIIANALNHPLTHVKLHGSLYHATERDSALADRFVRWIQRWFPSLRIIAMAAGTVARAAKRAGHSCWEEAFLDRAYNADGSLVPRSSPNAVLSEIEVVHQRLERFKRFGEFLSLNGVPLPIRADTFCIHSDSQHALMIAKLARESLPIH